MSSHFTQEDCCVSTVDLHKSALLRWLLTGGGGGRCEGGPQDSARFVLAGLLLGCVKPYMAGFADALDGLTTSAQHHAAAWLLAVLELLR